MFHPLESEIDMTENLEFKKKWLRYYLETHPVIGETTVTDDLVDTWLLAVHKCVYVSQLLDPSHKASYNQYKLNISYW